MKHQRASFITLILLYFVFVSSPALACGGDKVTEPVFSKTIVDERELTAAQKREIVASIDSVIDLAATTTGSVRARRINEAFNSPSVNGRFKLKSRARCGGEYLIVDYPGPDNIVNLRYWTDRAEILAIDDSAKVGDWINLKELKEHILGLH